MSAPVLAAIVWLALVVPACLAVAVVGAMDRFDHALAAAWADECRPHRSRHQPRACVNARRHQGDHHR